MKGSMDRSGDVRLLSDRVLWGRATGGDDAAFGTLFERHAKAIYNYCFRRVADWTLAEDVTSAVFLEAWRRRFDVRLAGDSVLPWLYGVAANLIRKHRRGGRRAMRALYRYRRSGRPPRISPTTSPGVWTTSAARAPPSPSWPSWPRRSKTSSSSARGRG
jgi:DNA-directed RNA polymerase specialized sigma24 family protein